MHVQAGGYECCLGEVSGAWPAMLPKLSRLLCTRTSRHDVTASIYQRASWVIWIRFPQVSFNCAMVEPVTSVGGIVNSAPPALMRS